MLYYTPPDKFDEDLDKPEYHDLQRVRRRPRTIIWLGAILLLAAVVAWVVLKRPAFTERFWPKPRRVESVPDDEPWENYYPPERAAPGVEHDDGS